MLIYIKEDIPSKLLNYQRTVDIQIIPIEVNFRKTKWLIIPIYRPPAKSKKAFNKELSTLLDYYASSYDRILVMGDFNMLIDDNEMKPLIKDHCFYNLIKDPTRFYTTEGRSIDLMLTNSKYSFMNAKTFDTGESDFHRMIFTIFKSTFVKAPPKKIRYRCFKNFNKTAFEADLLQNLHTSANPSDYIVFQTILQLTLDKHAPYKTKVVRGNNKPFINKDLRKAIATRSRLQNIARNTHDHIDINRYKQQRNFVKNLNSKVKRDYYKTLNPKKLEFNKKFWKTFKPLLSNKVQSVEKMILVEDNLIISDDKVIANTMNTYFSTITKSLKINAWVDPTPIQNLSEDSVSMAVRKFSQHPSILKIKSHYKSGKGFKFKHVHPNNITENVKKLSTGKSCSGDIPTHIIKEHVDVLYQGLTDCFNASIVKNKFPDIMKLADVTSVYKKGGKTQKSNYRPISILSPSSKVFERLLCAQIKDFMKDKLSKFLCGFRKGFSCEDALLRLIENWRQALDKGEIVGTDWMCFHIQEAPSQTTHSRTCSSGIKPASLTCWRAWPSSASVCT